mmetsp:Transcript_134745/g.430547  ORF Transcript_134745/g.430547 Transcript_134745/m.430547 type:complete len:472 (-) Transcript_134745:161-1576(-)
MISDELLRFEKLEAKICAVAGSYKEITTAIAGICQQVAKLSMAVDRTCAEVAERPVPVQEDLENLASRVEQLSRHQLELRLAQDLEGTVQNVAALENRLAEQHRTMEERLRFMEGRLVGEFGVPQAFDAESARQYFERLEEDSSREVEALDARLWRCEQQLPRRVDELARRLLHVEEQQRVTGLQSRRWQPAIRHVDFQQHCHGFDAGAGADPSNVRVPAPRDDFSRPPRAPRGFAPRSVEERNDYDTLDGEGKFHFDRGFVRCAVPSSETLLIDSLNRTADRLEATAKRTESVELELATEVDRCRKACTSATSVLAGSVASGGDAALRRQAAGMFSELAGRAARLEHQQPLDAALRSSDDDLPPPAELVAMGASEAECRGGRWVVTPPLLSRCSSAPTTSRCPSTPPCPLPPRRLAPPARSELIASSAQLQKQQHRSSGTRTPAWVSSPPLASLSPPCLRARVCGDDLGN